MSYRAIASVNGLKYMCRTCWTSSTPRRLSPALSPFIIAPRQYATSAPPPKDKKFDLPDEYTEEVFNALANNPTVMQAMHNVIEAFNRLGISLDKEPSVLEMWKIMRDHQI